MALLKRTAAKGKRERVEDTGQEAQTQPLVDGAHALATNLHTDTSLFVTFRYSFMRMTKTSNSARDDSSDFEY